MADQHDGAALGLQLGEPVQAAPLERVVAHGQHLVDQQDLRFDVDGHRKSQADVHPRRVVAYRLVDEAVQFGEAHDVVEALTDVPRREAQDGAVQVHVLAARQLRVEAGAQFQEG